MNLTRSQKRERVERLEKRKKELLSGFYMGRIRKDVRDQIRWFTEVYWKMPEDERLELRAEWNEYYRNCRNTPEYELFKKTLEEFKRGNLSEVKRLALKARGKLKSYSATNTPRGFDPEIWDRADWAQNYRSVDKELADLGVDDSEFEAKIGGGIW